MKKKRAKHKVITGNNEIILDIRARQSRMLGMSDKPLTNKSLGVGSLASVAPSINMRNTSGKLMPSVLVDGF